MRPVVWAPLPGRVELALGDRRLPMSRSADGWWAFAADLPAGTDYRFAVDGEPLPDPRSAHPPHGVHGPSRVVDHGAFEWTDDGWSAPRLADLVIYELHVGTFSERGTFEGVLDHAAHLARLGVNCVELMPVAEFAGDRGWGYDGVDIFAPHHAYGGPDGLKRLVDALHARGMAVLLDVVYNHLGPEGNYLGRFGPYFTGRYATPWGAGLNFDGPGSDEVRRFFIDNALMWLRDYHFDGLRLDAVHAIVDGSAYHLLEDLQLAVESEFGGLRFLVAESDLNDPRIVSPRSAGGYGIAAQWSDDLHHAIHALLTGERSGYYADFGSPEQLATALRRAYVYAGDHSPYRRRRHGRPHALAGSSFLAYSQNHDQVGNRAMGERLAHLVDAPRLRMAAALVMCSPFVPMLFMGEEWGASTPFLFFSSHGDPEVARATSEGRMREFEAFGWRPEDVPDPQDPSTFLRSRLQWDELGRQPHIEILEWYRRLVELRLANPAVRTGDLSAVSAEVDGDRLALVNGPVRVECDLAAWTTVVSVGGREALRG